MIYWQDRDAVREQIIRVQTGQPTQPLEHRIVRKDGSIRWVRSTPVPRYDDQGRLVTYNGLVSDITERKQAEEALARERDLLHTLMDNIPDTIYFKDAQSRFTRINAAQAQTLGVATPDQALGKTDFDFFLPDHASDAFADEQAIMRTGQPLIGKIEKIRHANGGFRWVSSNKLPLKDKTGQIVGTFGISRDITAQIRIEQELRQYAAELEARNEDLDAFAHTVAHDLKNIVAVIVNLGETFETEQNRAALPPHKLDEFLRKVAQRGRQMTNVIEELLLLSSVRQVEQVEILPLNMASIIAEARERLADLVKESRAEIILPEHLPLAMGHGPWIQEVWVNYLSNAIKYGGTPPRVEIGADPSPGPPPPAMEGQRAAPQARAGGVWAVRFWIHDNGPGLTPQEQEQLFKPFTQLNKVRAKGHGLGLSIVRRIVEKLGGQVGVESQAGQGSTFYFTLPGVT
jgi:PAS domain S-box-containing protein